VFWGGREGAETNNGKDIQAALERYREGLDLLAQQHGMVCVDEAGAVVRPALLWNDTRSAQAATDLIGELGGPQAWAEAVGLVPVASFTVTKLRWLATHEPDQAKRTAAVLLPHDWLLSGDPEPPEWRQTVPPTNPRSATNTPRPRGLRRRPRLQHLSPNAAA
jgi:FGGY family of carbohydrate kinases, N-terminal domain